jgi:hypothetical protein
MSTPAFTREQALDTIARVEAKLREGCRPLNMPGPAKSAVIAAAQEAAREGLVRSAETFKSRVGIARDTFGLEPDWDLYRPLQYLHRQPGAPVIPSQDHIAEPEPEGDPIRVAVIGDAHDSPHLPNKERFFWLGRLHRRARDRARRVRGRLAHDGLLLLPHRPGHVRRPRKADLRSRHRQLSRKPAGLPARSSRTQAEAGHITLGNHEAGAWKYDNFHPDGVSARPST